MKRYRGLIILVSIFFASCFAGEEKKSLSYNELRAAITTEVRSLRLKERALAIKREWPNIYPISIARDPPICLKDGSTLRVILIWQDPKWVKNGIKEMAYYCEKEGIFYYRLITGMKDIILGPHLLKRKKEEPLPGKLED